MLDTICHVTATMQNILINFIGKFSGETLKNFESLVGLEESLEVMYSFGHLDRKLHGDWNCLGEIQRVYQMSVPTKNEFVILLLYSNYISKYCRHVM